MKKLLHFVNPVYNVHVLQSENGSVSASPISGTYGTFKIAFDRSNKIAYVYSNGHYIGYLDGFTWDPIELKYIRLISDQGKYYEVAKYKNLKIAAFGTLSDARDWDGTIE